MAIITDRIDDCVERDDRFHCRDALLFAFEDFFTIEVTTIR